jgi:uncharacterized protein with PIN domain
VAGKLNGQKLKRISSLLDSLYTPRELATHIGITRRQVYRVYKPLGMPIYPNPNDSRSYLINGQEFCDWYHAIYQKTKLTEFEAYCLTCKGGVPIVEPQIVKKGKLTYSVSQCPECGRKISKILKKEKGKHL